MDTDRVLLYTTQVFTSEGAEAYLPASLSGGYRTSVRGIVEGLFPIFENRKDTVRILEIGGGTGRSKWAITEALNNKGITNFEIVGTEPNRNQINKGRESQSEVKIPQIQSLAEMLPFANETFDVVLGSQVLHWIDPKKLPQSLTEAYRVLKPGGRLIHATSGILDLGLVNENHFTRHPFVSDDYLPFLEDALIKRGLWNREKMGQFVPWNQNVNPAYHNFTLPQIAQLLKDSDFQNVNVVTYMFPCDTKEMELRLTNLAMINMHFFAGSFATEVIGKNEKGEDIPRITDAVRVEVAQAAFQKAKAEKPDLFASFDTQPLDVTIGQPTPNTFGEPVPVIVARKPAKS